MRRLEEPATARADYSSITGLRLEAQEKLKRCARQYRPGVPHFGRQPGGYLGPADLAESEKGGGAMRHAQRAPKGGGSGARRRIGGGDPLSI